MEGDPCLSLFYFTKHQSLFSTALKPAEHAPTSRHLHVLFSLLGEERVKICIQGWDELGLNIGFRVRIWCEVHVYLF